MEAYSTFELYGFEFGILSQLNFFTGLGINYLYFFSETFNVI